MCVYKIRFERLLGALGKSSCPARVDCMRTGKSSSDLRVNSSQNASSSQHHQRLGCTDTADDSFNSGVPEVLWCGRNSLVRGWTGWLLVVHRRLAFQI
mmetsp:Transcript_4398/g.12444  ORF Transcript_4398/g.12444 Transcript_4398/m.12444 type:complete len:98 (-) Transcript_4398:104-397(-)